MNTINPQDYYLYINWEDSQKNVYRIGILARIDDTYYMRTYPKKKDDERDAYSHGYIGMPGFIPGRLYKSTNQLFDFFQKRLPVENICETESQDCCKQLLDSEAKVLTDSFSVEQMPEIYQEKCKEVLLKMDKLQNSPKKNPSPKIPE